MLQFATPFALLAATTVIAPILIHLIRRPLQVVRLGTLRFLTVERRQVSSLRWQHLLLLALRCALLAALAAFLAGPSWKPASQIPARWIFQLPGAILDSAGVSARDKLLREGFEIRDLTAPRFTAPTAAKPGEVERKTNDQGLDVWSLLRAVDAYVPAGSQAIIFGPPLTRYFNGERPTLSCLTVFWHITESPEKKPVQPPTRPLRATIVAAENRAADGRYVQAMLQANGAEMTSAQPDWIFQLGDAPLPEALLTRVKQGAHLITDALDADAVVGSHHTINLSGTVVYLRQVAALAKGVPLLSDTAGETFLSIEKIDSGVHWRFATRFHPDWSDWPLGSAFSLWWSSQFFPPELSSGSISTAQALPLLASDTDSGLTPAWLPGFQEVDLRRVFWIAAALLFLCERALSISVQRKIR